MWFCHYCACDQARRENGVGGKLPRVPRRYKYKVHQNAPLKNKKIPHRSPARMLPRAQLWLSTSLHALLTFHNTPVVKNPLLGVQISNEACWRRSTYIS